MEETIDNIVAPIIIPRHRTVLGELFMYVLDYSREKDKARRFRMHAWVYGGRKQVRNKYCWYGNTRAKHMGKHSNKQISRPKLKLPVMIRYR